MSAQQLTGIVDMVGLNPPTVHGWARVKGGGPDDIRIEIRRDARIIAEGRLDQFRPGLGGLYGFRIECAGPGFLPCDLMSGKTFVTARKGEAALRLELHEKLVGRLAAWLLRVAKAEESPQPVVRFFPSRASPLAAAIQDFLAEASVETELCQIMTRQGSDKGNGWHNYTRFYSKLFAPFRQAAFDLFELGIGTNNMDVPSSMGVKGVPGASLRGWREFFPFARIHGGDIDERILFSEERISTYHVDQRDAASIAALWKRVPVQDFRVIIDDGLHEFEANRTFLFRSLAKVRPGGYFIIEDLGLDEANLNKFGGLLAETERDACLIAMPTPRNPIGNALAVIRA